MTKLVDGKAIDYTDLPSHLRPGLKRYLEDGILPGDFLRAVIRNDLREAVLRADKDSLVALPQIVRWFIWNTPPESYGNVEKMEDWSRARNQRAEP